MKDDADHNIPPVFRWLVLLFKKKDIPIDERVAVHERMKKLQATGARQPRSDNILLRTKAKLESAELVEEQLSLAEMIRNRLDESRSKPLEVVAAIEEEKKEQAVAMTSELSHPRRWRSLRFRLELAAGSGTEADQLSEVSESDVAPTPHWVQEPFRSMEPVQPVQELFRSSEPVRPVWERFHPPEPAQPMQELFRTQEPAQPVQELFPTPQPAQPMQELFRTSEPVQPMREHFHPPETAQPPFHSPEPLRSVETPASPRILESAIDSRCIPVAEISNFLDIIFAEPKRASDHKPEPDAIANAPTNLEMQQTTFGRLSTTETREVASGHITAIGPFLLDKKCEQAVQNLIEHVPSRTRVLTEVEAGELKNCLKPIEALEGVAGCIILGYDGIVIANSLPLHCDLDVFSSWALVTYMSSHGAAEMLGQGKVQQIVSRTIGGIMLLADFGQGLLLAVSDKTTTDAVLPLMRGVRRVTAA